MSRTFEELVGRELDALYRGALFLSGGDTDEAERLVADAVTLAFREHAAEIDAEQTRRWLDARLVRSFLDRCGRGARGAFQEAGAMDGRPPHDDHFASLEPTDLFDAARSIPPRPRAALWLVLFRRRTYGEAARALRTDPGEMPVLLGHRDVLMRELMSRSSPRRRDREIS